jgi:sugar lactone lactonase YvrE
MCGPLIAALFAVACGGESRNDASTGWQATIDTIGDTVVVRTLSGSVWGDTATLVAEVTIGVLDGADEYVIGEPRSIAVSPEGEIYLLDTQVPVLRAYSPDGTHLRDIGREGRGPGEYNGPDGTAVLPDGRILVRDPPNQRISVFASDGEYLTQWMLSGGFNTDRRFYVDTAGYSYVTALLERGVGPWDWEFGLVRYSAEGELLDTLAGPIWDYDYARVTASAENSRSVRRVPFSPAMAWSFSPLAYMVGGLSSDYRIDLFRGEGDVLRIEREWAPVPVKPEEAEERRRRITQGLQRQYGSWRWNGPDVPDTKPPFRELFLSWEGNLWVVLSQEGVPTMSEAEARESELASRRAPLRFEEPPAFDVFAPDGRYLGHVKVPEGFDIEPEPIVRGDYVWAVMRDELDVASVVRFRIVHP